MTLPCILHRFIKVSLVRLHNQTGETVTGEEAVRLGVVMEAVEKNQVLPRALSVARTIASNSPVAVQLLVRTLRHNDDERTSRSPGVVLHEDSF